MFDRWRFCYWKFWRSVEFEDIPVTIGGIYKIKVVDKRGFSNVELSGIQSKEDFDLDHRDIETSINPVTIQASSIYFDNAIVFKISKLEEQIAMMKHKEMELQSESNDMRQHVAEADKKMTELKRQTNEDTAELKRQMAEQASETTETRRLASEQAKEIENLKLLFYEMRNDNTSVV